MMAELSVCGTAQRRYQIAPPKAPARKDGRSEAH